MINYDHVKETISQQTPPPPTSKVSTVISLNNFSKITNITKKNKKKQKIKMTNAIVNSMEDSFRKYMLSIINKSCNIFQKCNIVPQQYIELQRAVAEGWTEIGFHRYQENPINGFKRSLATSLLKLIFIYPV